MIFRKKIKNIASVFSKSFCLIIFAAVLSLSENSYKFTGGADTLLARSFMNAGDEFRENSQFDSSIVYFENAVAIYKQSELWELYADALLKTADSYIRNSQYAKAEQLVAEIDSCFNFNIIQSIETRVSMFALKSFLETSVKKFNEGLRYAMYAIQLSQSIAPINFYLKAKAYYSLGTVYYRKGDVKTAFTMFDSVRIFQLQLTDTKLKFHLSVTYTMLALCAEELSDYDTAIKMYREALAIFANHKREISYSAAACYSNLMSTYYSMGLYNEALETGFKCVEIQKKLNLTKSSRMGSLYGKIGDIYTQLWDFEKAETYLLQSLQIFRTASSFSRIGAGEILNRLGELYRINGDFDKALKYSLEGKSLVEHSVGTLHPTAAVSYELLGNIYYDTKEYNSALAYYKKALVNRENTDDINLQLNAASLRSLIGALFTAQKNFDSAAVYLHKALILQASAPKKNYSQLSGTLKRLGDVDSGQKKYNSAVQWYRKAAAAIQESEAEKKDSKTLLSALTAEAAALEKLFETTKQKQFLFDAANTYNTAVHIVDEMRKQFYSDESKLFLAGMSNSIYANACRITLRLYELTNDESYKENAFLIADRSKANSLLGRLAESDAKHYANVPDSIIQKERSLEKTIAAFEIQLSKQQTVNIQSQSEAINTTRKQLFAVKNELQELRNAIERRYPKYYELKYPSAPVSIQKITSQLQEKTAIVEYLIDGNSSFAFVLTKNQLTAVRLRLPAHFPKLADSFVTAIKTINKKSYLQTSAKLYSLLIRPIETAIAGNTSLICISDGVLHYVPFEALQNKKEHSNDFTNLPYLINRFDIRYSYSASFLTALEKQVDRKQNDEFFAGFAPVFRNSTNNGNFLANRLAVEKSGISDVRSITLDGKNFNELKYSESEILSIADAYEKNNKSVKQFLHTAANEENFKKFSGAADIVHVATHGFMNEKNPKLSAIIFSQPNDSLQSEDGILYTEEAFNLDLHARLVVLSSCESGVGKIFNGEGMMALTRGIFYSGAKNVLYSLWKVSDKHTSTLMTDFYSRVLQGKTFSSSLRLAKMRMIRNEETAFPSKWSGFVLVGE